MLVTLCFQLLTKYSFSSVDSGLRPLVRTTVVQWNSLACPVSLLLTFVAFASFRGYCNFFIDRYELLRLQNILDDIKQLNN